VSEYHIDVSLDRERWQSLDAFTQGYVEAAFWLLDEEIGDRPFSDLAPKALAKAVADCKDFREGLPKDAHGRTALDLACDYMAHPTVAYDEYHAGIDFFLTRNRHGAGFWDRGLGKVGDELSEHAHGYGETNLYEGDDGQLYF